MLRSQELRQADNDAALWRSSAGEAETLKAEMALLEVEVNQLAVVLSESDLGPDVQAIIVEIHLQLGELKQRRQVFDVLRHAAENESADLEAARENRFPNGLEKQNSTKMIN
jgi:hypothetical protein